MTELQPRALNKKDFAAFGEVIELDGAKNFPINQGLTTRYHDLCTLDFAEAGGRPIVSVFRSAPLPLPHRVRVMERHPKGSQAFLPADDLPFLVLVAAGGAPPRAADMSLFLSNGRQGVNFYKNTWHHFQIVLGKQRDFIVIDRGGDDENLEEVKIEEEVWIPESAGEITSST